MLPSRSRKAACRKVNTAVEDDAFISGGAFVRRAEDIDA
jgi:hypothetical protein